MFKKYAIYALTGLLTLNASAQHSHKSSDATFVQKYEPEITAVGFAALGAATSAAVAAWFGKSARDITTLACVGSGAFAYIGIPVLWLNATSRESQRRRFKACLELFGISIAAAGLSTKQEFPTWIGAMATVIFACL